MDYYGLDGISVVEKEEMRDRAMRGGPFSPREQADLLSYCATDVDGLVQLLPVMWSQIDLPRALVRGRYMLAVARMERRGVPIDQETFVRLTRHWKEIKYRLIAACDEAAGIFVPSKQRRINPLSAYGISVLEIAREYSIDAHALADFADNLWRTQRQEVEEKNRLRKVARKTTGLTASRIAAFERNGFDHARFPGLDTTARSLASELPELGIGRGCDPEAPDEDDPAAAIWEELRYGDEKAKQRHDRGLIQEAAEQIAAYPGPVLVPTELRFSAAGMEAYVRRHGIPWPRLKSGALDLKDSTFREMKKRYPALIGPIHELRESLSSLRLNSLAIAADGRNRTSLWAFASRTGRNQPSNAKFVFGPSTWIRGLIMPGPGRAIGYCDWSQQELGIAAYLSGDANMQAAYASDDAYCWFARKVGAMPPHFTKTDYTRVNSSNLL
jgi:hypothetical protein